MGSKTFTGNFFEDFSIGQQLRHATPRTVTASGRAPSRRRRRSISTFPDCAALCTQV